MNRPDFSPAMLKAFLRLRADFAVNLDPDARGDGKMRARVVRRFCNDFRRRAGVAQEDFRRAWNGEATLAPAPRRKIWAAMDLDPAEAGIRFTDDGGQEVISLSSRAHRPSACAPDGAAETSAGRRSAPAGARPKDGSAGQ